MEGFVATKLDEFDRGKISRRRLIETLTLAATTIPQTGSTTAAVSCNLTLTNDLLVMIASSDTGIATVPASISIPAGQTNATFSSLGSWSVPVRLPTTSRGISDAWS